MHEKTSPWQFHWSFIASVGNERDCKKLHWNLQRYVNDGFFTKYNLEIKCFISGHF